VVEGIDLLSYTGLISEEQRYIRHSSIVP